MRRLVPLFLATFLAACGGPSGNDGGTGGGTGASGGSGGTGGTGGTGGGAGGNPLRYTGPTGPRRGAIALTFELDETAGSVTAPALKLDGGAAATVITNERDGGQLTLVWSSFDDVATDGIQGLTLTASQGAQAVALGITLDVRDALDPTRVIAVAHPLFPRDAGGVTSDGTELSLQAWDGGAVGTPRRITVGRGPSDLPAAPHGRAFAVVEDNAGTVSLLRTPLDGDPQGASVLPVPPLPWGQVAGARFSRDGRTLYVLGTAGTSTGQDATLWAYVPAEDLSTVGAARALATLARPPLKLDVDRSSGRILVAVGQGPVSGAVPRLLWFEPDGTPIGAPYEFDFSVANDLAIGPRGGLALSTSDLFGDELFLYTLGAAGPVHVQTATTVGIPYHVIFHPASTATAACALVTDLNQNKITPVLVTPTGVSPQTPLSGVPLAAELDVVERGTYAGTAFISSVSKVSRVQFQLNGTGNSPTTAIDFGAGTTNITGAIGIQR